VALTTPPCDAVADLTIQCLVESEFELTTLVTNLEREVFWYREIAREAVHVLHAHHLRLKQLERRLSQYKPKGARNNPPHDEKS
jgi:hypothetical protein